jgi:hypothetical protein
MTLHAVSLFLFFALHAIPGQVLGPHTARFALAMCLVQIECALAIDYLRVPARTLLAWILPLVGLLTWVGVTFSEPTWLEFCLGLVQVADALLDRALFALDLRQGVTVQVARVTGPVLTAVWFFLTPAPSFYCMSAATAFYLALVPFLGSRTAEAPERCTYPHIHFEDVLRQVGRFMSTRTGLGLVVVITTRRLSEHLTRPIRRQFSNHDTDAVCHVLGVALGVAVLLTQQDTRRALGLATCFKTAFMWLFLVSQWLWLPSVLAWASGLVDTLTAILVFVELRVHPGNAAAAASLCAIFASLDVMSAHLGAALFHAAWEQLIEDDHIWMIACTLSILPVLTLASK